LAAVAFPLLKLSTTNGILAANHRWSGLLIEELFHIGAVKAR
jgi:hypothetical protein